MSKNRKQRRSEKSVDRRHGTNQAVQGIFNDALQHHQAGRLAEAEQLYRQALALDRRHADSLHSLGLLARQVGRHDVAAELIGQAIAVRGDDPFFHYNLGNAFKDQGKLDEAARCYERALALKPDFAKAHNNLGEILGSQGKLEGAATHLARALAIRPDYAEAHYNLGNVLRDQGRLDDALASFQRAAALRPDADVHNNLGSALLAQGKPDDAIAYFRRSLALKPDSEGIYSNLLFAMVHAAPVSPRELAIATREFGERLADPLRRQRPLVRDADPERKLRIGYVSPDFRSHSVNFFFEPLLKLHDRQQFEIFAYHNFLREDAVTTRLKQKFDHWRDIHALSDDAAADLIEADQIDVLVDIAGHTAYNRLLVFARKPAPVQATWLGYPATTGMAAMDYRITDSYAEPPGMTEHLNTEKAMAAA